MSGEREVFVEEEEELAEERGRSGVKYEARASRIAGVVTVGLVSFWLAG